MRIIDAHNHPDWHGHDLDKYLANMDQYGIEKTWLMNWECPENEYDHAYKRAVPSPVLGSSTVPIPFSRCISYKERAPERFILGYSPDPRLPDACSRLEAAAPQRRTRGLVQSRETAGCLHLALQDTAVKVNKESQRHRARLVEAP